ncbi:MAG: S1C family serine protease [Candidatus Promineifilaceae bacterium]
MTSIFQTLSNDIGDIVAASSPHVVRIEARKRLPATGVVLGNGLIVTTHHVINKEKNIVIGWGDGQATANLVGRDPSTDLALLKTDAELAKMPIASEAGRVGNLVLALGRPGKTVRASLGIISALGDAWRTGMGGMIDQYVQNDLVMYPGFSGGPLVNAAGEMVGINTSALARGVSLTIPSSTVQRVADSLAQHGHIKRGYLGISTQTVKLPRGVREQIGRKTGLLIISVEPDSPAAAAGLVLGDTIVAFANTPISNHDDLLANLSGDRIGQKSALSLLRGGQLTSVDVVLSERK